MTPQELMQRSRAIVPLSARRVHTLAGICPDWLIHPESGSIETLAESALMCPHSWLHGLILTVDANFRLKLKDKSSNDDQPLGDGWAYWVREDDYQDHIAKHGHHIEVCDHLVDKAHADDLLRPAQPL